MRPQTLQRLATVPLIVLGACSEAPRTGVVSPSAAEPASSSVSAEPAIFVPKTLSQDGGLTTIRVLFTDGTPAELRYPSDVDVAGLGLVPGFTAFLPGACGNDAIVRYGDVTSPVLEEEGMVAEISSGSHDVFLWRGGEGFSKLYLRVVTDGWTVAMPCDRPESAALNSAEEWGQLLGISEREGYLVVDPSEPLTMADGDAYGPTLLFGTGTSGFLVLIHSHLACGDDSTRIRGSHADWCYPIDGGGSFKAQATFDDRTYLRLLTEELVVARA